MHSALPLSSSKRVAQLNPFGNTLPGEEQAEERRPWPGEQDYGCVDWYQYADTPIAPRPVAGQRPRSIRDEHRC
jgi:hypothetical protein